MEQPELKKENERLQKELDRVREEAEHLKRQVMMAVNLRFHLMPNVFPVFPDLPEVEVYADQISLAHVGGDFFDIFRIDADHIGLLVADIFDGGDAAALFMVAFKLYLQGELSMGFSPEELLKVTNNRLTRANEDNVCLSAWYGVYEVSTGRLRAVNAGHEAPLALRRGRAAVCEEDEQSYLMGVMEGMAYTGYEIMLEPGDALLLYTDGMTKAKNEKGEVYAVNRMFAVMEQCRDAGPEELVAELQEDFLSFVGNEPLSDDATLLCFRRKGGAEG